MRSRVAALPARSSRPRLAVRAGPRGAEFEERCGISERREAAIAIVSAVKVDILDVLVLVAVGCSVVKLRCRVLQSVANV